LLLLLLLLLRRYLSVRVQTSPVQRSVIGNTPTSVETAADVTQRDKLGK